MVQIPEKTWLKFDEQRGVEKLWLVFSESALPELDSLKQFAGTQTRGLITDPALNKAIKDFLSAHSTNKP